ncbi:Glycosyltransferase involved in cell wall bisynthesis [Treponema bryantii]|uniref:Glycosyltransferase involved in cell wall bisynthesis n=1 Tax=Treponema bryantii TaxID=163 RepID=A0A1I3IWG5_9SPIR|nr:hypothetical protein [Treponema bryantii]SFI52210.1 Glycosyltransferase involved in cell wall bisynthesis [Treponema bryantii]
MNKQKLFNNQFFLFIYRFCKVIFYRLIYDTFIYKLIYKHSFKDFLNPSEKYKLVVCHNGGGGTVSYMKNKYENVPHIIYLKNPVSADKDYLYSIENSDTGNKIYIKPKQLKRIEQYIKEIHVIAVESYMNLEFILPWFVSLNVPVNYDIHDYHCVWYETHFVHNGKYLSEEELRKSVLNYAFRKITFEQWYKNWFDFFAHVQTITAFSQSSKDIFNKFYPEYIDKVTVVPHSLDYIKSGTLTKLPEKFTIGIFGMIRGADKGCNVVHSFLEYSKNKDYQIYINGELSKECKVISENIHYMGRYDVERLDKLIEEQGISTVLFPSICPETFSYTVSELIHVGVPIACFNLGAQAEKVSQYKYGQIIQNDSNEEILAALKAAYEKGQNNGK